MKTITLPTQTAPARFHPPAATLRRPVEAVGLFLGLALLLTACSTTPKVQTEAKAGTDFSRFKTFALLPLPTAVPASDPGLMLRVAEPARQAVVETLTAKGFTEAERAQADLAVNLRGSSIPRTEVTDWGYTRNTYHWRYGGAPVHVGRVEVRDYDERTLAVEIYDNRAKELIWVGATSREATGKVKAEKVQEGIRVILARFPPVPGDSSATK